MNGRELQRCAAGRARELPATTLEFPFGPDVDVFKVRGKVFMFHAEVEGEPCVTLKALPSDSMSLRDAHADITPGYHMNKRHWITLHPGGTLTAGMVTAARVASTVTARTTAVSTVTVVPPARASTVALAPPVRTPLRKEALSNAAP